MSIYVDDLALFGPKGPQQQAIIDALKREFEITELGPVSWLLALQITYTSQAITLSQHSYIEKVLKKFNMSDTRPVLTPMDPHTALQSGTPEQIIPDISTY